MSFFTAKDQKKLEAIEKLIKEKIKRFKYPGQQRSSRPHRR